LVLCGILLDYTILCTAARKVNECEGRSWGFSRFAPRNKLAHAVFYVLKPARQADASGKV
jgi:hypothetical protein